MANQQEPITAGNLGVSHAGPLFPLFSIHFSEPQGGSGMNWSADAEAKLKEVPFFVRPAVRKRIEAMAAESGCDSIDLAFYEDAKARFGQK